MIRTFAPALAPALALALSALPIAAAAQSDTGADAARSAEAAGVIAASAEDTFTAIDPDSDPVAAYAGLPPLTREAAPAPAPFIAPESLPEDFGEAPRGPAVRMIAAEVAQPLPSPALRLTPAASTDPFVIKSILPITGSIRYGDWFWDEGAAPRAGKLVITVDLEARVISAFRDGHEIGTAVALLGTQEHPTPLGSFPILTKEKDNVSEKYDNAPMPYTLRLTWNGIAIHGSPVLNGYASHGCIGVPDEFAAKLFAAARRGDRVIITRGKMIGVGDKVM